MKKIIFWIPDIDKVYYGEKSAVGIGGAIVQMAFWAKAFAKNGFSSYCFTDKYNRNNKSKYGVRFKYFPLIRKFMWLLNPVKILWVFMIRPDWVVVRGNNQELGLILFLRKLLNYKVVYMLASDANVVINNGELSQLQDRLNKADFVVVQNTYQKTNYKINFNKDNYIVISNIWDKEIFNNNKLENKEVKGYDFIWVSNIRELKRPIWFIEMAKKLPNFKFALIGSSGLDKKLYDDCNQMVSDLPNIVMLGYVDLHETTKIIQNSKILVCTSKYEGFPNTFLQAWSNNVPVLSTVNPNNSIIRYNLGVYEQELDTLIEEAKNLINDNQRIKEMKLSISLYFNENHYPEYALGRFQKIIS